MRRLLKSFRHDARGATAIEYCLIASLISLVVIAAVTSTGQHLWTGLNTAATALGH